MYLHTEEACALMPQYLLRNCSIIEAGTCGGRTLKTLVEAAERYLKPFKEIWGFDSFVGLPKETEGIWHNPDWFEGEYSALKYFNLNTVEEAIEYARNNVGSYRNNVHLVPGFFLDTLTEELGFQLRKTCGFFNCDADLHSSTTTFMDWLLTYSVMLPGCIVRFDDWLGNGYSPYHMAGENLAFEEMTKKYHVVWENISGVDNVFIYREHI